MVCNNCRVMQENHSSHGGGALSKGTERRVVQEMEITWGPEKQRHLRGHDKIVQGRWEYRQKQDHMTTVVA